MQNKLRAQNVIINPSTPSTILFGYRRFVTDDVFPVKLFIPIVTVISPIPPLVTSVIPSRFVYSITHHQGDIIFVAIFVNAEPSS